MAVPPITLPVNKWLANLTSVIAYMQNHYAFRGTATNDLLRSCADVNVANGNGKLITSADILTVNNLQETSTLLAITKPTVEEQYITVDNFKTIPVSINKYLLRQSFLKENYSSEFAGYIRSLMEATKDIYIFKQLIGTYEDWTPTADQAVEIELTDPAGKTGVDLTNTLTANTNKIYKTLMNYVDLITSPTNVFNEQGFTQMISKDELKLTMNTLFLNEMNVHTLATLLNSSKITGSSNMVDNVVRIPYNQFRAENQESLIGFLECDKKVQYGYFYEVATEFFDASNLNLNAFLQFAYYMGIVKAKPMIKFTAKYV